jgi:glycosyltransferase involved in cell wall biosynthesis
MPAHLYRCDAALLWYMAAMFADKQIAVVVPAHNEEKLIARAVTAIPDYVDRIIVVDDASTDNTAVIVRGLQPQNARLTLVVHGENRGVGGAIVTGYAHALEWRADVVAVMAGDAQMDPDDLAALIAPVAAGTADYAKGDRLSYPGVFWRMPLSRFVGNHVLSIATRYASGYRDVRDSQCGFTAISAAAISQLPLASLWPRYGFPNDILAHLHGIDARLAQVCVRPLYGDEVSGISLTTGVFRVPKVIVRSWWMRRRMALRPKAGLAEGASEL